MWERAREALSSGTAILLMLVWLGCAVAIAVWVVDVTELEVRRRSAVGIAVLIWFIPIGVLVALDEFVVRRIRYGRPVPGRRKRGDLTREQLRALDARLKPRGGGASEAGSPPRSTPRTPRVEP